MSRTGSPEDTSGLPLHTPPSSSPIPLPRDDLQVARPLHANGQVVPALPRDAGRRVLQYIAGAVLVEDPLERIPHRVLVVDDEESPARAGRELREDVLVRKELARGGRQGRGRRGSGRRLVD